MYFIFFIEQPSVLSFDIVNTNSTSFVLNCISTNSPATSITITKDNELFTNYDVHQVLINRYTSTYHNYIRIDGNPDELEGRYSCRVLNSAGLSNSESIDIQGK